MLKKIKWIVFGLGFLLFLVLVALGIFLASFDVNSYKPEIEKSVSETLGRDFKIAAEIKFVPALVPTVELEEVSLSNAAWAKYKNMLQVGKVFVSFSLTDLILGKVKIEKIEVDSAMLYLEKGKDGKGNWQFEPATEVAGAGASEQTEKAGDSAGFISSYDFKHIVFNDAKIVYADEETGQAVNAKIKKLTLDGDGKLYLDADIDDKPLVVKGRLANVRGLLNKEKNFPLELEAEMAGNVVKLAGKIGDIFAMSGIDVAVEASGKNIEMIESYRAKAKLVGSLDALAVLDLQGEAGSDKTMKIAAVGNVGDVFTMAKVNLTVDVKAVDTIEWGVKPFAAEVKIREVKGTKKAAGSAVFRAGKTNIAGDIAIDAEGTVPFIKANLTSDYFSYDDIFLRTKESAHAGVKGTDTAEKQEKGEARVFSDKPINFAFLAKYNVALKADFKHIDIYSKNDILKADIDAGLQKAVLDVKAVMTTADAKREIKLDAELDASLKKTAAVRVDLQGKNIIVSDMFYALLKGETKGGVANFAVDMRTKGDSVHTFMQNLDGKAEILVEDLYASDKVVAAIGSDFVIQLIKAITGDVKGASGAGDIRCMVANLDFAGGKAGFKRKIALESDRLFLAASGDVDMGSETFAVALDVMPQGTFKTGISGMIASMVKIDGSFAEPSVSLNASGVASTAISLGTAIATGGISLLGKAVSDTTFGDGSPCSAALGRPVKASKAYQKKQPKAKEKTGAKTGVNATIQTTEKAVESSAKAVENSAKAVWEDIKKAMKNGTEKITK